MLIVLVFNAVLLNSSVAVEFPVPPKPKADAEVPAPPNPSLPTFKLPTDVQLVPFQLSVKALLPGPPPKSFTEEFSTSALKVKTIGTS